VTRDELIMLYYDGELDAEEAARVESLLAQDPAAGAVLQSFEQMGEWVREVESARSEPMDMTAQIMSRVLAEPAPSSSPALRPVQPAGSVPKSSSRRARPGRALVSVGTAIALAATVALVLGGRTTPVEGGAVARSAEDVAAPAAAMPSPDPEPPEQSVAIERIDFGSATGSIFLVPGPDERVIVVWTDDDDDDKGPEIDL
jgi:anti-sigma factor RsiW